MTKVVRSLGTAAVVGSAALVMQALYAGWRRLPQFAGFDATGSFGDPGHPTLKFVVVGDSGSTGPGLEGPDDIWVRQVARRLADRFNVHLHSLAVGGARSADVVRDQLGPAVELEPDLAFVAVGVNDMLRGVPVSVYERNLDRIVESLHAVSRLVVVTGMGDLGTIPRLPAPLDRIARGRGRWGDAAAARVAARHGAIKADMWGLTTEQFRSDPGIFAPDLFHPSAVGHLVWAEAAWITIEPHLNVFDEARSANRRS